MTTTQVLPLLSTELRAYQGGFFRVLVSPDQTEGRLSIVDMTLPKGSEPPRHVHTLEDETFFVVDGTVEFTIGDEVTIGKPGQALFAPRNVEHQFRIQSEQARLIVTITPGDFANYFIDFSEPITEAPTHVQAPQGPPPADLIAQWIKALDERFHVHFV